MNYHRGLYFGLLAFALFFAYKFCPPNTGKEPTHAGAGNDSLRRGRR